MIANSMCIPCFISKQEALIRSFPDEHQKSEYMHRLLELLYEHGRSESAPWIMEQIDSLYKDFWGNAWNYSAIKHKYNTFLLQKEHQIMHKIQQSEDPVKECIKYVCAGNYIDFAAVEDVSESTFETLLEKARREVVPEQEYAAFASELESAKRLVYLTDNCGEIVLDKVFITLLKEKYPQLEITAILRGEPVLNDATLVDAEEIGLTDIISCIGNGNGAPGTEIKRLSSEARNILFEADIIVSKGQGNFESLYGEGLNPYYLFLCKCELFVDRFGLEKFSSVFAKEERIHISPLA